MNPSDRLLIIRIVSTFAPLSYPSLDTLRGLGGITGDFRKLYIGREPERHTKWRLGSRKRPRNWYAKRRRRKDTAWASRKRNRR